MNGNLADVTDALAVFIKQRGRLSGARAWADLMPRHDPRYDLMVERLADAEDALDVALWALGFELLDEGDGVAPHRLDRFCERISAAWQQGWMTGFEALGDTTDAIAISEGGPL